jgi:hypothetical protein
MIYPAGTKPSTPVPVMNISSAEYKSWTVTSVSLTESPAFFANSMAIDLVIPPRTLAVKGV